MEVRSYGCADAGDACVVGKRTRQKRLLIALDSSGACCVGRGSSQNVSRADFTHDGG